MNLIAIKTAYMIMIKYLEEYAHMTASNSIKDLVNNLKSNKEDSYRKWLICVQNISNSNTQLTYLDAFNAMRILVQQYDPKHLDDDISILLSETQIFQDGITGDPAAWNDWLRTIDETLKKV